MTASQAGADLSDLEPEGGFRPMPMLAELVDAVVGVDTHRDTHTAHLLDGNARTLGEYTIANTTTGFTGLLDWIAATAPGPRVVLAVEGTRSYGLALTRYALERGIMVIEVEQPARRSRRGGKSDAIDAQLAARAALATVADRLAQPRADGDREALRLLLVSRSELTGCKTMQTNRLHALLLAGDDVDRALGRGKLSNDKLTRIARRRPGRDADRAEAVRRAETRRLALAIGEAERQLKANKAHLASIIDELAPGLLSHPGIGPVSAAVAITAFSHVGRVRSDAAFAALAGTCPIPASSGRTVRHRLNRGGDRTLNSAIHTIARNRLTHDQETRAYADRRRAEGKTDREITRCLKRYITRQLYRQLNAAMTHNP